MLSLHTPSDAPLIAQQRQVAELLLAGSTVTAAAAHTGIPRSTICHWCRNHNALIAALDAARRRRALDLNERIHSLADQAFAVLVDALAGNEIKPLQLRAALALLKMIRDDGASPQSAADPRDCWLDAQSPAPAQDPAPEPAPSPEPVSPPEPVSHMNTRPETHPRNLPCPCGSGIKYKRCCGAPVPVAAAAPAPLHPNH
jgi:uncharacterized protein YerC